MQLLSRTNLNPLQYRRSDKSHLNRVKIAPAFLARMIF